MRRTANQRTISLTTQPVGGSDCDISKLRVGVRNRIVHGRHVTLIGVDYAVLFAAKTRAREGIKMNAAQSVLGICVRRTETEEVSARAGGAQSEQRQGASGLLVIIAVVKFSVLRKPATNHFVIALAIADLAVGLNIPFYVSFYFDVPYVCDPQICLGRYFIALWSTVTSMLLM